MLHITYYVSSNSCLIQSCPVKVAEFNKHIRKESLVSFFAIINTLP